jgi:hypothetical protein
VRFCLVRAVHLQACAELTYAPYAPYFSSCPDGCRAEGIDRLCLPACRRRDPPICASCRDSTSHCRRGGRRCRPCLRLDFPGQLAPRCEARKHVVGRKVRAAGAKVGTWRASFDFLETYRYASAACATATAASTSYACISRILPSTSTLKIPRGQVRVIVRRLPQASNSVSYSP